MESSASVRKPHFFKIMIGDFHERLRIPDAFLKHLSKGLSDVAIVEGPSGSCWPIKVKSHTDGLYFEDGWEKFSTDHSLTVGECLVFSYNGDVKFNAKVFGRSACEREDTYTVYNRHGPMAFQEKRKRGRPRKSERKECGEPAKNILKPNKFSTIPEDHVEEIKLGQEHLHQSYKSDSLRGNGVSLIKVEASVRNEFEVKKAAYSFTSPFPYFAIEVRAYSVRKPFQLSVPASFAMAHLPHASMDVSLQNTEGKTWAVKLSIDRLRHCFSAGFNVFSIENDLKIGDYCVFEFLSSMNIRVHIFRVGDSNSLRRNKCPKT